MELVQGNLEDPSSLDRAFTGADALLGVTTPFEEIAQESPYTLVAPVYFMEKSRATTR